MVLFRYRYTDIAPALALCAALVGSGVTYVTEIASHQFALVSKMM